MNRLLLGVLMILPAVEAQEVETGLAAVRQRLRSHPVAQRKLSGLHHRAALVSGTLGETAAALERVQGPDAPRQLTYLRERLLTASRSLETDFASIEAKLAGLGLPEKLEAWHEFVRHYRARLAEVDAELAALAANGSGLSSSELRRRLAALRAKFGARAVPLHESVKGAGYVEPISREMAEVDMRSADDVPTPADLAESKVVLLTAEIRDRAQAMRGNAAALYTWVATHTEYVPYLGQMQNSLAVMLSGRGNAFDQATLLIALLRASGIPARYVCADVVMPRADIREWMGVKDESILLGLLSRGLGFSLFRIELERELERIVALGHVWVEAYLDTGGGKRWMALDPARKRRSFQPGIVLSRPPYDRMAYLKAFKPVLPAEPYLDLLRADLQKRFPGRGFNEVPYTGTLLPPPPPTAEAPYSVVKLQFRTSEIPEVLRHKINLSLSEYNSQNRYLNVDLSLPEIVLQFLTLSYIPATAADRMVAEAFGGMESAPAAVVNLLPEIRLAGQVIALGKTPVPAAATMDLTVTHIPVAQGTTQYVSRNMHTAGETAAVVLGAHQVSEQLLTRRISSFLDRLPAAPAAEATRRLLDVAAIRYLHRLGMETQRLSDFLQVRFIHASGVENAITFASLEPQNLFDRPFVVTPGRLRIHANPRSLPLVDLNRSDQDDPVLKTAWQLHNDACSALEHEVWEELVMIPSASTIKILETAIRDNIPIRTINRDNAAAELRLIQAPQALKDTMQQRINAGATLTAPQRPVTIGSWRGLGWIEEYANWSYAYIIGDFSPAAGISPGGDTGGTKPLPRPPAEEPGTTGSPTGTGGAIIGDPVNLSNGNLTDSIADFLVPGRGPVLEFVRTYNSLMPAPGPMGPGWRHNYQISLKDKRTSVEVVNETGGAMVFPLVNAAYTSPPGYNLRLTKDAEGYRLRRPNGVELRFDPQGTLQTLTDRNQNALRLSYDGTGLRRVIDGTGRGFALSYDGKGRLTAIEDPSGRRVSYEYDAAGHLAAATNAGGSRTVYTYFTDPIFNHLLKSVTTPEGRLTEWEYYGNGKVSRVTIPDGRTMSFLYLPLRNETHMVDSEGRLTSYQYNALGNVVRMVWPDGSRIDREYSADAKLLAQTDEAGYTTRFTYDAAGNLLSATDPLGRTLSYTYDAGTNLPTSFRNGRGMVTRFEYDSRGNLTRSIQPLGAETRRTWDAAGNLTAVTDAEGHTLTTVHDPVGNPLETRDGLGNTTRFEWDRLSRLTRTVDAMGGEKRQEYDSLDRLVRMVNPLGHAGTAGYDRDGRLAQTTDFGGRTAKFRYDGMARLAHVTDALGQVTEYGYDVPGSAYPASANLTAFRDAAGYTRRQTYDFQDLLTATTDALGNTNRYEYGPRGNIVRKTEANGNATTFEQDAAGQLTRKVLSDGTETGFSYDAGGNVVAAWNQHVALRYSYDELDRVIAVTDSRFERTIQYGYNRLGLRTSMTDPAGGVTRYAYDANRRLASLTLPSGHELRLNYDEVGNLIEVRYPGGNTATLSYDAAGRVRELRQAGGTLLYTYDNNGNPTGVTDAAGSHRFRYDELNRLAAAEHDSLPAESYTYDAAGNRNSSPSDPAYRYDGAGRLVAAEGATLAYDKSGNLVGKTTPNGTTTYSWNAANQLARVDLPGGGVVTFKYDPFGRRIEKNVNGVVTAWLYDGSHILAEMDGSGLTTARYTHGAGIDRPLALERDGETWFFHADALGNVVALSDVSGNVARTFAYDSWGGLRAGGGEGVPANPFFFAGREFDPETGIYFMRARYYDPAVGRFLSADPLDLPGLLASGQSPRHEQALVPQDAAEVLRSAGAGGIGSMRTAAQHSPERLNAYAYAVNNPLARRDPSGLSSYPMIHLVSYYRVEEDGSLAYLDSSYHAIDTPNPYGELIRDLLHLIPGVDKPARPGQTHVEYVGAPIPNPIYNEMDWLRRR